MNVLLLIPNRDSSRYLPAPDVGLAYVARAALTAGAEVQILDAHLEGVSPGAFDAWLGNRRFDLVGIKCLSMDFPAALAYASVIRSCLPNARTVLGGPHPSALPEFVLENDVFDFAVIGEGELPIRDLVQALRRHVGDPPADILAEIPSLAWRDRRSGKIRVNPVRFAEDLDSLGLPAWDLFDIPRYPLLPGSGGKTLPILTTRGCPAGCLFCTAGLLHGRSIRTRSLDSVFTEIAWLHRRFALEKISIFDDNFTGSRTRVLDFCRRFTAEAPLRAFDIPQGVRLDGLDPETVSALQSAGCRFIGVGIESGSDETLSLMHKGMNTAFITERLNLVHAHSSIEIMGFFILGFPHETAAMIRQTITFAMKLPLDAAGFTIFTAFPGTPSFDELVQTGTIRPDSIRWQDLSLDRAVFPHPRIPASKLKLLQIFAYLGFYFRPSRLAFFKRVFFGGGLASYLRRFGSILGIPAPDGR